MGEVRDASPALLLGRYRSEAIVGEGAFGRVVRAFDMRLKRPVAIKTLKRAMAQTDLGHFRQLEDRFIREAEAGARVGSHANLVTVYDLVEGEDRSLHLILLYVSGGTIGERLASHGPFALADALRLTADIARGLQAAHDAGIVHRDVKPANIFIAMDGRAQVGDFGIAQLDHLSARTYTFVGHPGTPLYMSPEQSQQTGYVRPTSDQYSAGLVLFEMLHGQPYKRLRERDVADFLATLPSPVAALIERMTATAADDRYREMRDVAQAIRRIEQSLDLDLAAPAASPRDLPPPTVADAENASEPPDQPAIPVRPIAVPSNPTPDNFSVTSSAPVADSAILPVASLAAPSVSTGGEIAPEAAERPSHPEPAPPAAIPTNERIPEPVATPAIIAHDQVHAVVRPGDVYASVVAAPAARRSRGGLAAVVGALLVVLVMGGFVGASRLSGGRGGGLATATAPEPVAVALSSDTAAASPIASPTPSATVGPLLVAAATATNAPTATVAVTPQPTVAPSPTATAIPPTATATPAPSLGVFGVGATDRGDLETLSPADAADTFTAGQEVFAFVNYDGARPGVDTFDITLIANGTAYATRSVTAQKPGGFVFASLGKPGVGTYRIEVRHGGALLPNQPTFQVKAPPSTPAPVVAPRPAPAPATGGQAPAAQPQPAAQPKVPTCVPGTC